MRDLCIIAGIIAAFLCGFCSGKRSCPSDEAWLEVKKYTIDKEWEYINRLRDEERNNL